MAASGAELPMPLIAGQPPPRPGHLQVGPSGSVGLGLAVHQRDYISGEPLQTLDALRNGLAAAIEDQLVHADRRESSNVAGNVFRLAGESSAGHVRRWDTGATWLASRADRPAPRELAAAIDASAAAPSPCSS